jgi:hypothetical protein
MLLDRQIAVLAERSHRSILHEIRGLTLPVVPRGRLRFLSFAEWGKLKKTLGAQWPVVRFAILSGLRRGEQFALTWADVDLKRGLLTLPDTKAGGIQYLTLSQEAVGLLKALPRRSRWVFPSQTLDTPMDPNNFYRRVLTPAVTAAKMGPITWHGLRHTGASWLAMSGASDRDIASYLRHASTALVGRYAHLSPAYQQGLMERVSAFKTATYRPEPFHVEQPPCAAAPLIRWILRQAGQSINHEARRWQEQGKSATTLPLQRRQRVLDRLRHGRISQHRREFGRLGDRNLRGLLVPRDVGMVVR